MLGVTVRTTGVFLVVALLSSQASLAQQTQGAWLLGMWEGNLQDYAARGGKGTARRFIEVTAVAPDGTAQGVMGIDGEPPGKAKIRLKDSQVHIVNAAQSVVELLREGDDRLVGKLTSQDGRVFSLTLEKMKCLDPASLIGEWGGRAIDATEQKLSAQYYLTITRVQCNTVWGTWEFSGRQSSKGPLKGRVEGNQLTYGPTTLGIRDNQMTGGFPGWKLSLDKKK